MSWFFWLSATVQICVRLSHRAAQKTLIDCCVWPQKKERAVLQTSMQRDKFHDPPVVWNNTVSLWMPVHSRPKEKSNSLTDRTNTHRSSDCKKLRCLSPRTWGRVVKIIPHRSRIHSGDLRHKISWNSRQQPTSDDVFTLSVKFMRKKMGELRKCSGTDVAEGLILCSTSKSGQKTTSLPRSCTWDVAKGNTEMMAHKIAMTRNANFSNRKCVYSWRVVRENSSATFSA